MKLLDKADDKLCWGLIQHGPKEKRENVMRFFIKPFRKVDWVQFQEDNPYYPNFLD